MYPVIPHTSKAMVSIFCGIYPKINLDIVEGTQVSQRGRERAAWLPVSKAYRRLAGILGRVFIVVHVFIAPPLLAVMAVSMKFAGEVWS